MKSYVVSPSELARHFGVTTRMVSHYVEKGMPKVRKGRFDLNVCWRWRFDEKQKEIDERTANLDKDKQDARLKRVQADLKERELAELDSRLVDVDTISVWVDRIFAGVRAGFLSLPTKLAPQVIACTSVNEAKVILEREIHQAMRDVSRTEIKLDDLEAAASGDASPVPEAGAAAKPEPGRVGRPKGVSVNGGFVRARKVPHRKGRVPKRNDGRGDGPGK